jgi:arsenate reductase-like glutaredoxin family protein
MGAGITLWVRPGSKDSDDARSFLKSNRYAADVVKDIATLPPRAGELDALAKGLGGDLWPLVDLRNPRYGDLLPRGAEGLDVAELKSILEAHPGLLKDPLLLTPKGALAGFRESKWRAFLDIGKGRS